MASDLIMANASQYELMAPTAAAAAAATMSGLLATMTMPTAFSLISRPNHVSACGRLSVSLASYYILALRTQLINI